MIKVAGYCRVSTDKQDQINSFLSQKRYFREYIQRHSEWELYDVYADEGVTGTNTNKRSQFNKMMHDAHQKCFDLIITKEVSRFSRNILDTIAYTRELKALGIGVIFMNDGLNTLAPDAELRLSIMGSIAQEESRKTSERVKWGQTRQMEQGVVFGHSMLGYDVSDGILSINQEGAEVVKRIFYQYGVLKKGTTTIARELCKDGIKTLSGNPVWSESYILKILKNEKYVGDLIQKKTITPDYLTHAKKYNHGEEKFVVIANHHEPIITRELWDLVQKQIVSRRRRKTPNSHSNQYLFSGKILCAECGASFVSRTKTRSDGSSYKRWGCATATREGRAKKDIHGNNRGCNVGKQIRDELAMDILRFVISELVFDRSKLAESIAKIVAVSINDGENSEILAARLKYQQEHILKKKTYSIDAYLSGVLTKEELEQIKAAYDDKLQSLGKQLCCLEKDCDHGKDALFLKIREASSSILNGQTESNAFLKSLLDYIKVYKDGTIQVKLNRLNWIWKFKLIKGSNSVP